MGLVTPIPALKIDDPQSPFCAVAERARNRQLTLPELFHIAENLKAAGQKGLASELYKLWIAFNEGHSHLHLAFFNFAVSLRDLDDLAGAINALRECVRLDPTFGPARINLGHALEAGGQVSLAVAQWRELADQTPAITGARVLDKLMALQNIGRVFENTDSAEFAEEVLRQAMELRPDKVEAGQHWISLRQRQCKWPALDTPAHVSSRQLLDAISPLSLAAHADDPMFQLAKAYHYNKTFVGRSGDAPISRRPRTGKVGSSERLRVGYVSSDFRDHAVGFALCEALELHDKGSFEIFAYYCGETRAEDATQARIRSAVDHWLDIGAMTDVQAAMKIDDDQIDILVDLNGYTKHARTKIFAYRPAPIIVNWCGYPGTMGSPYHQYLIADETIVPPENEIYYSEKVLRIPCNQPIDRKRTIAQPRPTRAQVGLPEDAFVYACFNGMQKLTPNCFSRWMTILSETPGSVLWLLTGDEGTNTRLRKAAAEKGVAPERILFAQKAANPQHLARISLADLFLDTLPYGAHSTAADALMMGLPILTLPGRSFASRFCASVVAAAGLNDLMCATPEDYVQRAVALGRDPERLRPYKEMLNFGRYNSVLYNIPALVRRLEELFLEMQVDYERGAAPIPDLTNLDIYYEIGTGLDLENIELLSDTSYRALYAEALAKWSRHSPIPCDRRFWPEPVEAGLRDRTSS